MGDGESHPPFHLAVMIEERLCPVIRLEIGGTSLPLSCSWSFKCWDSRCSTGGRKAQTFWSQYARQKPSTN